MKRPKTAAENNLLVQSFLKSIKQQEFQRSVLIFSFGLIVLYAFLFNILGNYAQSGGSNEYAIYNSHERGFAGMFLKNTLIYLFISFAIGFLGLRFYIYNSHKLNPIIGNEMFNPKGYIGKWVEHGKSTSYTMSLYQMAS